MDTRDIRRPLSERLHGEQGVALIIALLSMLLLTALGMALTLTTTTEHKISTNYRDGIEAMYAADAAIERVMQDVLTIPDWNNIINGNATSSFVDGVPGTRTFPDGSVVDLLQATAVANCGKTSCTTSEMDTYTPERPWGPNNPRWTLFAYGPVQDLIPTATINSPMYVVVWMADDPSESDNNPLIDGDTTNGANPGTGVLSMLAQAFGPGGVSRVVEATIARTDSTEIERGYTGQRGQDEQNRRARKAAVQTPGKALTQTQLTL
jgi:hypothetical protein